MRAKKRRYLQRTILLDADNAEKYGDFYPSYLAHFTGNLKDLHIREGYTEEQIDAEIMVLYDNGYIVGDPDRRNGYFVLDNCGLTKTARDLLSARRDKTVVR